MSNRRRSRDEAVAVGLVSGVVGGMVASFVMSQFQRGLSSLASSDSSEHQNGGEDATVKTASAVSESVIGRELTEKEKRTAGPAVHYAFGATMGAVYGVLSAIAPAAAAGWGLPFGTALWLAADEVAVPVLGLSKAPTEYPASTHASALASHLVYGLSVDLVRRGFRAAL